MTGKSQTLTKGQQEDVVRIFWSTFFKWILALCTVAAFVVGTSLWGIWNSVEKRMEKLVAAQFEEPQVQAVVREAAADRASVLMTEQVTPEVTKFKADVASQLKESQTLVDLVAQEASKAKALSEEVADKNQRAEEKLEVLDRAITKATSSLTDLEAVTDFTMTVVAAQNDDRKAFDKLEAWSKDKAHRFCDKARQAWDTIRDAHASPMSLSFPSPWKEGFDPSKLTLAELARNYQSAHPRMKPALLEYIWKREDIARIERLDFLMGVMQQDESLMAVEYAGRHFTSGTDQKVKPLAVEFLSTWWKEHRNEFVQK